ncbi:hypothetical protein CISIN_1g040482mg, partial [Citrus sinensis]
RLAECFAPLTGWRYCFASMIDFLEDCVSDYQREYGKEADASNVEIKPFLKFVRDRFKCIAAPLKSCIVNFCTRIPKCYMTYIGEDNFHVMANSISLLDSFETLLFEDN